MRPGEVALADAEPVLGQYDDGATLGGLVGKRGQLRGVGDLLLGVPAGREEVRRHAVAERDGARLVEEEGLDVARGLYGPAAHGEHVALHQAVHAGDADRREEGPDGGRDEADQQRDGDDDRDRGPGVLAERLEDDHHGEEDDRQHGQQDGEGYLVGCLLAVGAFDERDHAVQKRVPGLGRDLHDDAVGQHGRATGDGGAVAARLPDDRGRFSGDGRLVHRGDALDDVAVGRDDVARLAHDAVALAQRRGGDDVLGAVWIEPSGHGLGTHLAQRLSLCLATALGHGLGEVGEEHGQEQPDRDRPVEQVGVRQGLDERDHRPDQDDEHDRVPDLDPWVELGERTGQPLQQDLAVEQAALLGDAVRRRRVLGRGGGGFDDGHQKNFP